jgi:very-short-patch-repair endonuclease
MRDKLASPPVDGVIAAVAARQHGVALLAQLVAAGLSKHAVSRRVAAGRLHRVYRGVYAVGHAGLSQEGRWMAAVLACGVGAVLSHNSAAALWGMLKAAEGPIHVTVPTRNGRARRPGLRLHRVPTLSPSQTTRRGNIPVTKPSATLDDLRRTLPEARFRAALRQAEFLRLPIGDQSEADGTRSELERRLLALCRRHGLPMPEVNVRVGPYVVDFLWRTQKVVVETDGFASHGGRAAFEDDRARRAELRIMGYEVLPFSYRQVMHEPTTVVAAIRAGLGRPRI